VSLPLFGDSEGDEPRPIPRPPDRPIYTPPGGPPATGAIDRGLYERMGEGAIRRLIRDFYGRIASDERIASLFPKGEAMLAEAAERSADFFVFLFGGPPLYQKRWGRPMLRARHLPFRIDEAGRAAWMECFRAAADDAVGRGDWTASDAEGVCEFLEGFSGWMVNAE